MRVQTAEMMFITAYTLACAAAAAAAAAPSRRELHRVPRGPALLSIHSGLASLS